MGVRENLLVEVGVNVGVGVDVAMGGLGVAVGFGVFVGAGVFVGVGVTVGVDVGVSKGSELANPLVEVSRMIKSPEPSGLLPIDSPSPGLASY